jgi:hypothetical protein
MLAATVAALTMTAAGVSDADAQTYLSRQQNIETDYHVVADGDTLWDLSGRFYGDSYQWPRMWSYNSHITNPHWIYPGDIVYLRAASSGAAAQPGANSAEQTLATAQPSGLYLPIGGYITKGEVPYVGRIRASRKGGAMLAEFDTAWVGFGEQAYSEEEKETLDEDERFEVRNPEEVRVGDRFSIVREIGQVEDEEGNVVAHKYVVLGVAQLTETSDEFYDEIDIVQSWREIYRGDMLIPYERQLKVVKQTPASTDEVAKIIDTLKPGRLFAEHNYVFINKGAADGVRTGNRFFAYQRFEGLHMGLVDGPLDENVPWTRVGQMLIVDVREHYSTALVIDSSRELAVGDRLEMYNGH